MTIKEVTEKIGEGRLKEFLEFMRGQTVGIYPNGEFNYYEQDVENFLRPKHLRFFD